MRAKLLTIFLLGMTSVVIAAPKPVPFQSVESTEQRILTRGELDPGRDASRYAIKLPTGESLFFDAIDVVEHAGVRTIRGKSATATFLLTTDGMRGYGYVLTDNRKYVIDTEGRTTKIVESSSLSPPAYVPNGWGDDFVVNHDLILEQSQLRSTQDSGDAKSQVLSIVDVAVFYDQSIADNEGLQSPRTRAQAAIDYTNAAIATHGVELELQLTYVGPLSTPLSGDPFAHFNGNSAKNTTRDEFGADLVHYMYPHGSENYCGRANLPGSVGVSALSCNIFVENVAHEIGHNFGLHHDRANASATGLPYSGYNYGYVCGNAGTIMAYYFPTLPHYSSPLLQNNGEVCGVDIGQPDAAYNGAVLDVTRASTANFRTRTASVGNVWINTAGPFQINENDANPQVQVTVIRDGDLNVPASVEIGTVGSGATAGQDFIEFVERLEFAPGETTKQVMVSIIDDEKYEASDEEFQVVLRYPLKLEVTGSPLPISIISDDPDRGIVSFRYLGIGIEESEGTLQILVDRTGSTLLEHTVDVQLVSVDAVAGTDYVDVSGPLTFGVGESVKTFDVPIIDDDLFEGNTNVQFNAYLIGDNVDASRDYHYVWIWNDDFYLGEVQFAADSFFVDENAGTVSVEVERINGNEGRHSFCVNFLFDGTAINGIDYNGGGSICTSISDGQTSRTIFRNIYDNAEADGEKFFDISLISQSGTTGPRTEARVFIVDDEPAAGPTGSIQFGAASFEGTESSGMINVPVSRIGGSFGGAVANYATSQGTATSGTDFTDVSGSVFWFNGDSSDKIIQIPVVDDSDMENAETLQLSLSGISGAVAGSPTVATVTISASDQPLPPAFEYSPASFSSRLGIATLIDFEGYVAPGDFLYLGTPGLFSQDGVTVTNNSQMFVQNNNFYGLNSFLSPQGADPQIVDIALPGGTKAVAFLYGAYVPVSGTVTIDGGQQFSLPEVQVGALGFFAIAREVPIESLQIDVNGSSIDIDNLVISSNFRFTDLPQLVTLPDVTADGVDDIAVMREGSILAEIRSGSNGALQKTIAFLSDAFTAIDAVALPDADGNGIAELAVLASRNSDGRIVAEVRNITGTEAPRQVWFAANHTPFAIRVVEDDADNNGVAELAVLSTRNSDGRMLVEVKNAFGAANPKALWYIAGHSPVDLEVVPDKDANGIPEIAVLSSRNSDGRIVTELKNAAGASLPSAVWFMPGNTAIDLVAVDDKDANGIPEVAVLSSRISDGSNVVEVKNAAGAPNPTAVWFITGSTATNVAHIHDADNNGIPEVAVLSVRNSDGRVVVQVKNVTGPPNANAMWYSPGFTARGLATLADSDSNGVEEALVLMIRDSDGRILVEGRNAAGSPAPKQYWFSP